MIRILFIHQWFPGQFRYVASEFAMREDMEVAAICHRRAPSLEGIKTYRYDLHRVPSSSTHHYVQGFERDVLMGQAVLRTLINQVLKEFVPDVVIAHPGWGETLFLRECLPNARIVLLCEYYAHPHGAGIGFDPEFPASLDARVSTVVANATWLLSLSQCDSAVAPTQWQRDLFPAQFRSRIGVLHDGIDTDYYAPDPNASFQIPDGPLLRVGDPVVTFVARELEPARGFHTFMRAIPHLLASRPDVHIVVLGGDQVIYSPKPGDAASWREKLLNEIALSPAMAKRLHLLGTRPKEDYRAILRISAAHIYLTYPIYLSWSLLEAMSTGCLLLASATAPVKEVIVDGKHGILVDFFDSAALAKKICHVLDRQDLHAEKRHAARETVMNNYGRARGLKGYLDLAMESM